MAASSGRARYAAFLRGVMPMNAKMTDLKHCFEEAGLTDVKTVLGSGNVVFGARAVSTAALERRAEAAMASKLGRSFLTIVRPLEALRALVAADPFADFRLAPDAKRIVTFLRRPARATLDLPLELDGARILGMDAGEVFSCYVASSKGPVFMTLIERTFGQEQTTRTWDTVKKVAAA
jgi:uncharacterized protein (DUF1697 family)